MKKINIAIVMFITSFVFMACEKVDNSDQTAFENNVGKTLEQGGDDDTMIPPHRETDYGDYQPDHPNGPYPDISCDYVGWDCLVGPLILGQTAGEYQGDSYTDYCNAVDLLDGFINENNTAEFFVEYFEEAELLMPGLYEGTEATDMVLNDLQNGCTTVQKFPKTLNSEQVMYLFTIIDSETGEPPVYN